MMINAFISSENSSPGLSISAKISKKGFTFNELSYRVRKIETPRFSAGSRCGTVRFAGDAVRRTIEAQP